MNFLNIVWTHDPEWWRYVGLFAGWVAAFCLPYGERTPYPVKALVGCTFSAPLLFMGLNPWMVSVPVLFFIMFILSNKAGFFSNFFVWKIVEMAAGFLIGISTAFFIQGNEWLMIGAGTTGLLGFAIGGTGFKPARRFIMPFILTWLLFFGLR